MKNNTNYGKGMPFETLMRRALKTHERSTRKGTCSSIYETLLAIESGKASYGKQLETVKKNLKKGLTAFLRGKLHPNETVQLENLVRELNSANYIIELDSIIDRALNITESYRNLDRS